MLGILIALLESDVVGKEIDVQIEVAIFSSDSTEVSSRCSDIAGLTENEFENAAPPTSAAEGAATFQRILLAGARRAVPAGRRIDFVPGIPREVMDLRKERDDLRHINPTDPEIDRLNDEIKTRLRESKQEKWREH